MEGRLPPDGDDLFEWTDAPARPPRVSRHGERERPGTGERERAGTGERDRVGTGEREPRWGPESASAIGDRRAPQRDGSRGDTGEFERSGRRPPPGRRARRRDLPARVRRRQDLHDRRRSP